MRSADSERFELRRSRRLLHCTIAGHLVAAAALAAWPAPLPLRLVLAGLLAVSLTVWLRRPWPMRLGLTAGGWSLTDSRGRVRDGGVIAGGRLLPGVIAITFTGGFVGCVVLLTDAFSGARSDRLRALLRHRRGGLS